MDETSVGLVQTPKCGVVIRCRGAKGRPRLRATRAQQRTNLTYVAFVSDDADLQKHLPQFIIGSRKSCFTQRDFPRLFDTSPPLVFLIQGDKSWTTSKIMGQMIRVLGACCRGARPDAAFAFSFDAAPTHIYDHVWWQCHAEGLWPLLVPAKVTWLLQPLDAYVFRIFKDTLRRRYHDRYATAVAGGHDSFLVRGPL